MDWKSAWPTCHGISDFCGHGPEILFYLYAISKLTYGHHDLHIFKWYDTIHAQYSMIYMSWFNEYLSSWSTDLSRYIRKAHYDISPSKGLPIMKWRGTMINMNI